MNKFAIVGDSTCDLPLELRKQYDVTYARMQVSWVDKNKVVHEIYASLDWEDLSPKEYNDVLRNGYRIMTTQITEKEFDLTFRPLLKQGLDILYIACSSGLSASLKVAEKMVREKYSKEFPKQRIVVVDSLCSCMGQGSMIIKASEMRKEGKTIDEVAKHIEETRLCYNQAATVESLEYLKRAGRVKASSAFFGNLFGVKPMLISDTNGINYAVEKVKGRRNSLIRLSEMIADTVIDSEKQTCWVLHADASQEDVDLVVSKIKEKVNFKEVRILPLGPIITASCGPGTFGIYYFGKEVTVGGE